jgi:hypothetical protein
VLKIKITYDAKKNPNIQVKDKLSGKECWLREVFRLIVAAIDEIRKTIHELHK